MKIQFNTDNNIPGIELLRTPITMSISEALNRFSGQLTRVEVHLSDKSSNKNTLKDKRCVLEARIGGMPPIAVSSEADTIDLAVSSAIDKLKISLETSLGRLKKY